MTRSSRRPRRNTGIVLRGVVASGELVARNPAIAGGTTAFLVSLSFISANALWYQPHFHDGAFFATRHAVRLETSESVPIPTPSPAPTSRTVDSILGTRQAQRPETTETTGAVNAASEVPVEPTGNRQVWQVQSALAKLGLYKGAIDGLSGPHTREAIENYQRIIGTNTTGAIDEDLLEHLGVSRGEAGGDAPPPTPRPAYDQLAARQQTASISATPAVSAEYMKIEAGLKAFGNDGIKVDGIVEDDTRAALREFQSLFGLPVSGEPDDAVYAKMKDIGLIN